MNYESINLAFELVVAVATQELIQLTVANAVVVALELVFALFEHVGVETSMFTPVGQQGVKDISGRAADIDILSSASFPNDILIS